MNRSRSSTAVRNSSTRWHSRRSFLRSSGDMVTPGIVSSPTHWTLGTPVLLSARPDAQVAAPPPLVDHRRPVDRADLRPDPAAAPAHRVLGGADPARDLVVGHPLG